MSSPESTHRAVLSRAGPMAAADLQRALGFSAATMSRRLRADADVLVVGRARATRYALRRVVEGVRAPIEVFDIGVEGHARMIGALHPVAPFGHWFESAQEGVPSAFFETDPRRVESPLDLPWFLLGLAPAGFLGRAWARAHADHGFPADPARWEGDDVLRYACLYGVDTPGALVLGRFALEGASRRVPEPFEPHTFPERAAQAVLSSATGSSAGGDQPKFTLSTPDGGWIVKFSPPLSSEAGRRWADLLVAEHLAARALASHGVPAAESELHAVSDRMYLAVRRFDRHPGGGRSGMCSLLPFDQEGVGRDLRRWSPITARLVREGRLSAEAHDQTRWVEAFGEEIANTDMHPGNLSLRLDGARILGLAPIYDMLPMHDAPLHGGELPPQVWRAPEREGAPGARAAARAFWASVAEDPRVSDDYRREASRRADED